MGSNNFVETASTSGCEIDVDRSKLEWEFVANVNTCVTSPDYEGTPPAFLETPLVIMKVTLTRNFRQHKIRDHNNVEEVPLPQNTMENYGQSFKDGTHKMWRFADVNHLLSSENREEMIDGLLLTLPMAHDDIATVAERLSSFVELCFLKLLLKNKRHYSVLTFTVKIAYTPWIPAVLSRFVAYKYDIEKMRAMQMRVLFDEYQRQQMSTDVITERRRQGYFSMLRERFTWRPSMVPSFGGDSAMEVAKKYCRALKICRSVWRHPWETGCGVCMGIFRYKVSNVVSFPCHHFFHETCIDPLIQNQIICPTCSREF